MMTWGPQKFVGTPQLPASCVAKPAEAGHYRGFEGSIRTTLGRRPFFGSVRLQADTPGSVPREGATTTACGGSVREARHDSILDRQRHRHVRVERRFDQAP